MFQGGKAENQGTWVHPEVAVDLAKWLSPEFRVLVNRWILAWMSGQQTQQQERFPIQAYTRRVKQIEESVINLPEGYWCVFVEAAQLLIYVEEKLKFQINEYDLLDGSIGIHWSRYREGKSWAGQHKHYTYKFPDSRRYQKPKCYPNSELLEFRDWLTKAYKPKLLHNYLLSKYGKSIAAR